MYLNKVRTKNSVNYYACVGVRKGSKVSTHVVARLGSRAELCRDHGLRTDEEVESWCRRRIAQIESGRKEGDPEPVQIELVPGKLIPQGQKVCLNAGFMVLQQVLHSLGFTEMIGEIMKGRRIKYDFGQILAHLVYARILDPKSKLSTFSFCQKRLLDQPTYQLHDLYRALDVLYEEREYIQAFLYKASSNLRPRNKQVLFYDCTNFYFEIMEEDEMRRYGHSKENRPNPIVQMGLFVDGDGVPLGFDLFPGNENEQPSLVPIESRIIRDFELGGRNIIVCTDSGLASQANRRFNSICGRDFITIKPLRRLKADLREWALDHGRSLKDRPIAPGENPELAAREMRSRNWREFGSSRLWCLDDIDDADPKNYQKAFYKERLVPSEDGGPDERLIITYSLKYRDFMRRKRASDIRRAEKLIRRHDGKKIDLGGTDDARRFIKSKAKSGGAGGKAGAEANGGKGKGKEAPAEYELDLSQIAEDARYDGLYGVMTSIPEGRMPVSEIVEINRGRWQIEESFRIMKTEFRSRPVYVHAWERVCAHFTTCFMALLVFRLLEFKINEKARRTVPAGQIISALKEMNVHVLKGYYTSGFERSEETDLVGEASGMRFDVELLTPAMLEKYVKFSKAPPARRIRMPHPPRKKSGGKSATEGGEALLPP